MEKRLNNWATWCSSRGSKEEEGERERTEQWLERGGGWEQYKRHETRGFKQGRGEREALKYDTDERRNKSSAGGTEERCVHEGKL